MGIERHQNMDDLVLDLQAWQRIFLGRPKAAPAAAQRTAEPERLAGVRRRNGSTPASVCYDELAKPTKN